MEENNPKSRRNLLRSLGVSTSGIALGITSMTGTVAARYPIDPDNGSIDDPDWDNYEQYTKENELNSTSTSSGGISQEGIINPSDISVPNPVDLGFNACGGWGDGQLCLDVSSQAQTQYYDCADKYIRTVSFTITKQTIDRYGNFHVDFEQKGWFGMDESNCLHVGVEAAGQDACIAIRCPWDPTTATTIYSMRQELNPVADDILQWLDSNSDVSYTSGSPSGVVGLALFAAALFLAIILGGLGMAA